MININWNNIITLLSLKGTFPEEARPLIKRYCHIIQALIKRDDYLRSTEYKEMIIENVFDTLPVNILLEQSQQTFKQIIFKYGYTGNTKTAA